MILRIKLFSTLPMGDLVTKYNLEILSEPFMKMGGFFYLQIWGQIKFLCYNIVINKIFYNYIWLIK